MLKGEKAMKNIIKTKKGFTLVELVIVIVIVGILSVISVPIYRGYVEKAKMTEGNVLLSAIAKAEFAYHVQNGAFRTVYTTDRDSVLDIDASSNKYFKLFFVETYNNSGKTPLAAKAVAKGEKADEGAYYDDVVDEALIQAGYETPQGWLVVSMTISSTGGCSDIETLRFGSSGGSSGGNEEYVK